jgi:signal transduction histidine kinase
MTPMFRVIAAGAILCAAMATPAGAVILWSDPASRVIHATPDGSDILAHKVRRDAKDSDALYFKFHVDPLSDAANEPYYAFFQLVESNQFHLAVGNAMEAWGYSAAYVSELGPSNKVGKPDDFEYNLQSAHPEGAGFGGFQPYELPSHNHERTIVFKVQFVPGNDALVTVWLDPDLTHGATAENQPENLTTKFKAKATFDEIHLRFDGGGNGWIFSDMAIATSFNDFVVVYFWQRLWFITLTSCLFLAGVVASVRFAERKKYRRQILVAEQERALERERARIAEDLHDDLGSLLTRISLLGGLLRADKDNPEQVELHATKIAHSADQTVRALEEIVWAVRPGSDTLQSLLEYLAHFANEQFEGSPVRCRLDLPHDLPARRLPPEMRHNAFLIVKEALTNALRHAAAREVRVQAKVWEQGLEIVVQDDGRGCAAEFTEPGGTRHGIGNMHRRAETMGGTLTVDSAPGHGTTVRLRFSFPDGA